MISELTLPSPLHRLNVLSEIWGIDLWVKRDDLIPEYLGGNKVRKTHRILRAAVDRGDVPQVLITNGGTESNHARVVALIGARLGCTVYLVLHGTPRPADNHCGNAYFYHAAGAEVVHVESSAISGTIDQIERQMNAAGKSVLVIPGGGHCHEAVDAYADAVAELPFLPDFIVHASGTGGTQAGLITGVARYGEATRVIGISVAREASRGAEEVCKLLGSEIKSNAIMFDDTFRFGGYERSTNELLEFLCIVLRYEGLPLDPTYTGKAMFGLAQLVEKSEIPKDAQVVFWHTGGLLNLQAS